MSDKTLRLGQAAKLKRDAKIGEIIGLRRISGTLYAELEWERGWSTSAAASKVEPVPTHHIGDER